MAEQSNGWFVVFLYLGALVAQLHPGAAMGASFGCVFFMFLPDPTVGGRVFRLFRKAGLTVVSWGFGYAAGIAMGGTGAMFAAVLGGSLAAAVLGALNLMILNDGDLPNWLNSVIRAVLRLKTRGRDEH